MLPKKKAESSAHGSYYLTLSKKICGTKDLVLKRMNTRKTSSYALQRGLLFAFNMKMLTEAFSFSCVLIWLIKYYQSWSVFWALSYGALCNAKSSAQRCKALLAPSHIAGVLQRAALH